MSQKLHTFYFCYHFVESQPIFVIFGTVAPEQISNKTADDVVVCVCGLFCFNRIIMNILKLAYTKVVLQQLRE